MAASANPRGRLLHILEEIDGVSSVIAGMTYAIYRDSYVAVRVVERALEIISEAARALPTSFCAAIPRSTGRASAASATSFATNTTGSTPNCFGISRPPSCRRCGPLFCA
jgi:hypothetical protein